MNVSVVLPSFNRARLLPITIPTYFQEDVSEVILVDDCSSDNTAEVVKELQTRFPTLRYFRNEVTRSNLTHKMLLLAKFSQSIFILVTMIRCFIPVLSVTC